MQKEQVNVIEEDNLSAFEQSLKSNDTEERIDIWFYRPIGYRIAQVCAKIGITPNAVTIISIFGGYFILLPGVMD